MQKIATQQQNAGTGRDGSGQQVPAGRRTSIRPAGWGGRHTVAPAGGLLGFATPEDREDRFDGIDRSFGGESGDGSLDSAGREIKRKRGTRVTEIQTALCIVIYRAKTLALPSKDRRLPERWRKTRLGWTEFGLSVLRSPPLGGAAPWFSLSAGACGPLGLTFRMVAGFL